MDTAVERFAFNLRAERQRKGLSQEALGYQSGLHRTEVSLIERAGREPKLTTIVALANGLDITPCALFKGIAKR